MIGLPGKLRAILIPEDDGVIDVRSLVGGGVGHIALTSHHFLIPPIKGVGVNLVSGLGRCCRCSYRITVVIGLLGKLRAILIPEDDGVINVNRLECGSILCIALADHHILIPAVEDIAVGLVRSLGGCAGRSYDVTLVVNLGAQHRAIPVLKHNRVIQRQDFHRKGGGLALIGNAQGLLAKDGVIKTGHHLLGQLHDLPSAIGVGKGQLTAGNIQFLRSLQIG